MDNLISVLNFMMNLLTPVVLIVGGLFLKNYLPTYFQEKGKNLATREDVEEITDKVEAIKSQYIHTLEEFRVQLQEQSELVARKRELYDGAAQSLRIFLRGRVASEDQKQVFLAEYSRLFVWAPDSVVMALGDFLDEQIAAARDPAVVDQNSLRHAYTRCLIEMRKDAGYLQTDVGHDDYKFVYF